MQTWLFFSHDITFPKVSVKDALIQAATDIVSILVNPPASTLPTLEIGDDTKNALLHLSLLVDKTNNSRNLLTKSELQTKIAARKMALANDTTKLKR